MKLAAVVLTLNEAKHLSRCLTSIREVAHSILVVDCFSSDETCEIAKACGARVVQHPWFNHATQFNWALTQLGPEIDWVLRLDADEYLTPALANEILTRLPSIENDIAGIFVVRRMTFQGRMMRHGGLFPIPMLRLFRRGRGHCENRWMDEHVKVNGLAMMFNGELVDDNLNSLTWWTDKHNRYASREVVDLLNLELGFMPHDSVASLHDGSLASAKRWVKERIYARMPGGIRALAYFIYRYVIRLGFLDGREGLTFHFLQGFWYRFLVDAKLAEVKRFMRTTGCTVEEAIERVLEIKIQS